MFLNIVLERRAQTCPSLNSRKSSVELWNINTTVVTSQTPNDTMTQKTRPSIRHLAKDFAERTSCHGIGQIYGSDNLLWRVFWVLAFLGGFSMLMYQGILLLKTYLDKPVATSLDVSYSETVSFPAVTVCNLNMIQKNKMMSFPDVRHLFHTFETMSQSNNSLNGSAFFDNDMKAAQKGRMSKAGGTSGTGELNDINMDTQTFLEEQMVRFLAQYKDSDLEKAGHSFEKLVFRCVWNGFECNKGDFLQYWRSFWHWRYGNCYIFNLGAKKNGTLMPHLTSSKSGPMFGLTLDLFIDQDQYIGALSKEAGVKVLLSDQRKMAFPTVDGFNVAPGVVAYVGIRKLVIERVDPFNNGSCYSQEQLEDSSIYKSHRGTLYSVQGCMNSCLAIKEYEICNCTEGKFRIKAKPCMSKDEITCQNDVEKSYENGSLGCAAKCPQPCTHYSFRRSVSQATWSDAYEADFQRMVKKSPKGFDSKFHNDASTLRKNFLRVKLYFEELNLEKITYSESYPVENLLGDVGGQLGLWIGVSVITVAEFGKLFLDLLWCLCKKIHWQTEQKHSVVDISMESTR